jgi:SSS family solute:Na+ symporter
MIYPHSLTAVLASSSADVIRRNAMLLPAYSAVLGLIALMGLMAHAAGIKVSSPSDIVPALINTMFPSWFAGFAFAAIAIGALVPAAIMSIGAANLFTRNLWKPFIHPGITSEGEARVAKLISLIVKFGALVFIVALPGQYAINLQLLGGVWILQTFPALIFPLMTGWYRPMPLLTGWAIGMALGTGLVLNAGLTPTTAVSLNGTSVVVYTGLLALVVNVVIATIGTLASHLVHPRSATMKPAG